MFRGFVLLLSAAFAMSAQTKLAVINSQQAVLETAEIKKASKELETKFGPRQQQLDKLQKEIADLQTQMQQGQGKYTPQAMQDVQLMGQRKQREATRLTEDLQAEVERERNDILGRAGTRMRTVVEKLANERGFDLVVDSNDAIFFKPVLEITKDATTAYDKAYPVQ